MPQVVSVAGSLGKTMAQPKPLASSSAPLLARKGTARPAMRPQTINDAAPQASDDLGWNDMGGPSSPVAGLPVSSAIAARILRETPPRAAGAKIAFTLRLDTDRHLRLRLASAVTGRSSQQLVAQALDAFLHTVPEVDGVVAHLPPAKPHR